MTTQLLISFTLATLFETLTPGPTLALVLETRATKGTQGAQAVVAGIAVANLLWVLLALFLIFAGASWIKDWSEPLVRYLGPAYLIFLAASRVLSSSVALVTQVQEDGASNSAQERYFRNGFLAHAANPITVTYYLATFSVAAAGNTVEAALGLGLIAVLSDLVVYSVLATVQVPWLDRVLRRPFACLLAGLALFYLIAHVFAEASSPVVALSPATTLCMLAGFVCAAFAQARSLVLARAGRNNKVLWRIVALWGACFSALALLGAVYALLGILGPSTPSLSAASEQRIRICFVVAAVVASAIAFAKAFGELQDEKAQSDADQTPVAATTWQGSPLAAACVAISFLVAVFVVMTLTGFRVS